MDSFVSFKVITLLLLF